MSPKVNFASAVFLAGVIFGVASQAQSFTDKIGDANITFSDPPQTYTGRMCTQEEMKAVFRELLKRRPDLAGKRAVVGKSIGRWDNGNFVINVDFQLRDDVPGIESVPISVDSINCKFSEIAYESEFKY
jgi:hypothetical protein